MLLTNLDLNIYYCIHINW